MNDVETLILVFFALCGLGALASLVVHERSIPKTLAVFGVLAGLAGLVAGAIGLSANGVGHILLWSLPGLGILQFSYDRLSALFMVVAGLIFIPVSLFSSAYLKRYVGRINLKPFSVSYLALLASIVAIPIAGDIFSFLIFWELMALLSYLLVNAEHEREGARRASYLMLAIGEAGTLAVAVAFLILADAAGSTSFSAITTAAPNLSIGLRWTVFSLSFFGFSTKVGLVPVNFWLPRAHPVAPANISAILSGLILNLGLYGILRVNFDLLPITTSGPGVLVMIIGAGSALVGILYATIETDLKKILAYSSIENMGIIATGLGAGLIFQASGRPILSSMAIIAALYHMTNHSLYKTLLFLGAGAIDIHVGTRNLDELGGLLKKMPWTGLFVLVGVLSIAAMPPFNGFVSEWLTLQSLLRSVELASSGIKIAFVVAGVALALTAGLAVTCFVRVFAMSFLGMPRSADASRAEETSRPALVAMAFLAIASLMLGILPTYVIPAMDRVVIPLVGASATTALVPPFFDKNAAAAQLPRKFIAETHDIGAQVGSDVIAGRGMVVMHRGGKANPIIFAMSTSYMFVTLVGLLGLTAGLVWLFAARRRKTERRPRWDGGVRRLLPEMTYTATGFAQPVRVIFEAILRPDIVDRRENIAEHFQISIQRNREEVYLVDRLVLHPMANAAQWIAGILAGMHHGRINAYAGYALLTIVAFLTIATLF
jgi:hydrogenase-4 component B